MKHKRNILAPLLVAPALLALVPRGDQPTFAPEPGTSLTKRIENSYEISLDDMSMVMNGAEMDASMLGMEMTTSTSQVVTVVDKYEALGSGRPTSLRRTFEELSSATSIAMSNAMMGDQDVDAPGSSELEGLTVVFTWDDDAGEYEVAFADDSDGDADLLEGLAEELDLRGLLPEGEVSEGDAWDIEPDMLRQVFAPGGAVKIEPKEAGMMGMQSPQFSQDQMLGEFDGEVAAEYVGTREEDGVRVAVIRISADISSARDLTDVVDEAMAEMELPEGMELEMEVESFDMEFMFEGEGELLWNLGTGLIHSLHLSGEVNQTIDTAMNMNAGGMEQALEQSMSLSGTHTVTITTEG